MGSNDRVGGLAGGRRPGHPRPRSRPATGPHGPGVSHVGTNGRSGRPVPTDGAGRQGDGAVESSGEGDGDGDGDGHGLGPGDGPVEPVGDPWSEGQTAGVGAGEGETAGSPWTLLARIGVVRRGSAWRDPPPDKPGAVAVEGACAGPRDPKGPADPPGTSNRRRSSCAGVKPRAEFTIGVTACRTPGLIRLSEARIAAMPSVVKAISALRRRTSVRPRRANQPIQAQTATSSAFRASQTASTLSATLIHAPPFPRQPLRALAPEGFVWARRGSSPLGDRNRRAEYYIWARSFAAGGEPMRPGRRRRV